VVKLVEQYQIEPWGFFSCHRPCRAGCFLLLPGGKKAQIKTACLAFVYFRFVDSL